MIYQGQNVAVKNKDNIGYIIFNNKNSSVNKFDKTTLFDLDSAVKALKETKDITGLVIQSTKKDFIVGADITEFINYFSKSEEELLHWLTQANGIFSAIENLPYPTVSMINGTALGGGLEVCLATDYRIMHTEATVGLPEVKLGIFPGFGGTVRLPRLIGADNAIEWICTGKTFKAEEALKTGVADAVVDELEMHACHLLEQCQQQKIDWQTRRKQKTSPLALGAVESMMVFETAKGFVKGQAGPHYPSPVAAIKAMQAHADLTREQALLQESKQFVKMAKTPVARNLVTIFLNDQFLKKKVKSFTEKAKPVSHVAVIGAGIMGGGIAYQSAYKGVPVLMKDIEQEQLDKGMAEAGKLLNKQVERKKIDIPQLTKILFSITPTLYYSGFEAVNVVIEAVVENKKIKSNVLKETEAAVKSDTVICSNTSTLSITSLAESLTRPENFCGMHFFNPVHRMPLVEIIRGKKTSEKTIATTVACATQMGKTPVVVNDCPGFFVNRILFPYFAAFSYLVNEQVSFTYIDKIMESFGWPMGPAWLLDVVGLDTAVHATEIMAKGFPERMSASETGPVAVLFKKDRLGQKNHLGFYRYKKDKKGKLVKHKDEQVIPLLYGKHELTEPEAETITDRMMIPMAMEAVRCLEERIIASPAEADIAVVYGIGFPPFRGGIFRYIDELGLKELVKKADALSYISPLYAPTDQLRTLAEKNTLFYEHYQKQ